MQSKFKMSSTVIEADDLPLSIGSNQNERKMLVYAFLNEIKMLVNYQNEKNISLFTRFYHMPLGPLSIICHLDHCCGTIC